MVDLDFRNPTKRVVKVQLAGVDGNTSKKKNITNSRKQQENQNTKQRLKDKRLCCQKRTATGNGNLRSGGSPATV